MSVVRLELPLPPSPNAHEQHPMQLVKQKNRYKSNAFFSACSQSPPLTHPPERVGILWELHVKRLRDEDNAWASIKWALDAIRQPRKGETFRWRRGISESKGWIVDDDKVHVPKQHLEQYQHAETRLIVTIRDLRSTR